MVFLKRMLAATATAGFAALAAPASAAVVMTLSDGTTTVNVADGSGADFNPAPGVVTYIGGVGCFVVNVSTGLGDAALPTVTGIDLNSVNVAACESSKTLTLTLSQNGFTAKGNFLGQIGGTLSNLDLTYAMYVDGSNALGGTGSLIGNGAFDSNGAFSASFGGDVPGLLDPYSMTLVVALTGQAGVASFDFEGSVPEPGSLALLGLAISGLGFVARRRNRQ